MTERPRPPALADHPARYELANELHARPFPVMDAPGRVLFVAIKAPKAAATRDRGLDRAHLIDLLDRFGAHHPKPGATHYFGDLGRFRLKWECHTEFTTYTVFLDGVEDRAFDPAAYEVLPADWLARAPGARMTAALIRIERLAAEEVAIGKKLSAWFVPESLATARVLDDSAILAGDFRLDAAGYMRFALFARPRTKPSRIGRIVQRMTEIETYKSMALLGLPMARDLGQRMGGVEEELTSLVGDLKGDLSPAEESLDKLLAISAELENLLAGSTFRFGATGAYEALVHDRISVLREERYEGRQTFTEFMMRRFDPAMRTVRSAETRLRALAERSARAGELLRTRVDVERQAQNQRVLEAMNTRADLALKLQATVEGLSVVAISYYALNLASYAAYPLLDPLGVSKGMATAILVPVVVLAVFLMIRRIRRKIH